MGTLYVVATPIGNLEDVSARALRILRTVELVAAEDTRVARKLLDRYGIKAKLISFNDHNKSVRLPLLIEALSEGDVALVTDAGTPAVSDPGVELVAFAREAGHVVTPVPGPSAVTAAISASGIDCRGFRFVGFLPREAGPLRRFFESLRDEREALVAFESPNRIRRTLDLLAETMPGRRVAVCRELTKLHEEVFVGSAADAAAHFAEPRGEFVLVVEGAGAKGGRRVGLPEGLESEVRAMKAAGLTRGQAASLLGPRFAASHRQIYRLWQDG
jgi:16S rRNA (cytidine1402-2'-O)-methyltransferase